MLCRPIAVLSLLLICLSARASEMPAGFSTDVDTQAAPWTNLDFPTPDDFHFAIIEDRTGSNRPNIFEDAIEKVNQMRPDFVICVGDLIQGYSIDSAKLQDMRTELDGLVGQLKMPFFYVAGNHDYSNETMADLYKKTFGRSYYHFVYKNTLFLVLNSEESLLGVNGSPDLTPDQTDYVRKVLDENPDVRWTFVFLHKPIWAMGQPIPEWDKIQAMFTDRPCTVFAGHDHRYAQYQRDGHDFIKLATTGGASGVPGAEVGQSDQFVWVSVSQGEPQLLNIELSGLLEKDIFTEAQEIYAYPLRSNKWYSIDPVVRATGAFDEGKTALKVENPLDVAMKIHVIFEENPDIEPTPCEFDLSVEPGQKAEQAIVLKAATPKLPGEFRPLNMVMTLSLEKDGQNLLVLKRNCVIDILKEMPASRKTGQ